MKYVFPIFLLIFSSIGIASSKNCLTKIAVVDTGLNINDPRFQGHLCKTGHKNFVANETLNDIVGHGTFVVGLIQQYAKNANYCMLIYKYYSESSSGQTNAKNELLSFKEAVKNGATVVNFSAGGPNFYEN